MLNKIILWSLRHRLIVIIAAVALLIYGGYVTTRTPVDVFPDLTAPTVTVLTDSCYARTRIFAAVPLRSAERLCLSVNLPPLAGATPRKRRRRQKK